MPVGPPNYRQADYDRTRTEVPEDHRARAIITETIRAEAHPEPRENTTLERALDLLAAVVARCERTRDYVTERLAIVTRKDEPPADAADRDDTPLGRSELLLRLHEATQRLEAHCDHLHAVARDAEL